MLFVILEWSDETYSQPGRDQHNILLIDTSLIALLFTIKACSLWNTLPCIGKMRMFKRHCFFCEELRRDIFALCQVLLQPWWFANSHGTIYFSNISWIVWTPYIVFCSSQHAGCIKIMKVSVSSIVLVLGRFLTFFLSKTFWPLYLIIQKNVIMQILNENICFQLSKSRNALCYTESAVSILPLYVSGTESPALSETSQNIEIQMS